MDKNFKELLKQLFTLLKPLGYKKDGQNFRLFQENGISRIINFQKSSFNTKDDLSFTVNVGVYDQNKAADPKFKEYDCQYRERPACVSKRYGRDTWWQITPDTDMEALYQELAEFLERDVHSCLDMLEKKLETKRTLQF